MDQYTAAEFAFKNGARDAARKILDIIDDTRNIVSNVVNSELQNHYGVQDQQTLDFLAETIGALTKDILTSVMITVAQKYEIAVEKSPEETPNEEAQN